MLTNTQLWRLCKAFTNKTSANKNLSKVQLYKKVESRGLVLTTGLLLMKNELKMLMAKNVLIPLGLTAASATDTDIQKKVFGSGMATLTILNKKMDNETIKNKLKALKNGFLGMLLNTVGASSLGNL